MERLIPQKAALCTSGLLSHRSNISKPMERQKAMGVSALSKQDRQLTRKEIYSMLMYWLFKKGMQKTQIIGLPLVITCTAGFACFMVSVPHGPGQPKCLFSIIISLFTLKVNSFTDSWWQKQPGQEGRDWDISSPCTSHRGKNCLQKSLVEVSMREGASTG